MPDGSRSLSAVPVCAICDRTDAEAALEPRWCCAPSIAPPSLKKRRPVHAPLTTRAERLAREKHGDEDEWDRWKDTYDQEQSR